jgi:processive 1,2-diacylglycerol beta-glucosyltransferase
MKLPKKRLLILSVRVGSGHIRAAEALEKVAKENFGLEVNHVNFLEYIDPKLAIFFEKMWYLLVKYAPFLEKVTYEAGRTKPNIWFKNLGRYLKVDFKKYKQLVREYKPDIIVSTHYLPAAIISWMSDRLSIPNGVVITDHIPHSMWFYPGNDVIFAADQWVLDDLKKMGVKKDKICLSGIPVGKEFLKNFDIDRLKNKFNLKTKKTTLLLMGGGDAVGPFLKILKSLAKEKMENKFQLIVIAGNNKKRQDEIKKIIKNLKIDAKVVGFVKNIEEYMAVSDLLISKPGGLTTTEAITTIQIIQQQNLIK